MKRICLILILTFICIAQMQSQQPGHFLNPVIKGDMADPSIIRIGNTYYAVATSSEWAPFYPVFASDDLVNWNQTGHIFNKLPEWTSSSFWAPEFYYHNNTVYCYYTARRKSDGISYIGVATSDEPTKEFTDHGLLIEFGTEAIDAFVYDDNGQLYISWKAYGLDKRPIELVASKLSADGLRIEGEPFSLLVDDEDIGMEGQYHFKKGDYYYIIYAAHGCCGPGSDYDVYVARSKNFIGPYEKYEKNPILKGANRDYLSCGHGTTTDTPDGRMFYMCHAYLTGDGFYNGRQPILQEVIMGNDKWPRFVTGNIAKREQPMPFAGTVQNKISGFEDRFNLNTLAVEWTWNYPYSDIITEMKNGKLLLSGTPKEGNNFGTALCLRPQSPDYNYQTLVTNNNMSMKGLTMYGDSNNLIVWCVIGDKLMLKSVRDGQESVHYLSDIKNKPVYLQIEVGSGCMLDFLSSDDGKNWKKVNETPFNGSHLTRWDRVARPGLIHIGNPEQPAEFSFFKLENITK